ncbi:hypothetical protein QE152_g29728 [Popillia japonica]|uniref:Uncharacterized protein n=1 Tax=Popillia japonica TaxID=7064 RepID=A0AAW1JGU2_POPJA
MLRPEESPNNGPITRLQRAHHPPSSLERFHLPRRLGGRSIPSAITGNYRQIRNLRRYFKEEAMSIALHSAVVAADKNLTPLRLAHVNFDPDIHNTFAHQLKSRWKVKPLHG